MTQIALPPKDQVIEFEHLGPCYWLHLGFRALKENDYYLSRAVSGAFLCKDIPISITPYHIVTPTYHASKGWVRGKRINVPSPRPMMAAERPEDAVGTSLAGKAS